MKSRTRNVGHAIYFWKAPWEKGLARLGRGVEAYPWLCMKCGAIIPYVDEDLLDKLRVEFEKARAGGFRL